MKLPKANRPIWRIACLFLVAFVLWAFDWEWFSFRRYGCLCPPAIYESLPGGGDRYILQCKGHPAYPRCLRQTGLWRVYEVMFGPLPPPIPPPPPPGMASTVYGTGGLEFEIP